MALSPSSVSASFSVRCFLSPKALLCLCIALSMALCASFLPVWLFPCFGLAEAEKLAITQQQFGTIRGHKGALMLFWYTFKDWIHHHYCAPNEGLTSFYCESDL